MSQPVATNIIPLPPMPQSVHALCKGERTLDEEDGYEEEGIYASDNDVSLCI